MSKRDSLARYTLIINKLRRQQASFEEILDYLNLESEIQSGDFNISKRTFQRDLNDIRELYGLDIKYNRTKAVYYIDRNEAAPINERILEAYDTFNALRISDRLTDYIQFEQRKSLGTENLFGLIHAIEKKVQVSFKYLSYIDNKAVLKIVEPYRLKEFKGRWYIIGIDVKDEQIKSFGLDRVTELEITKKLFSVQSLVNVDEYYRDSFGIVGPNTSVLPEEVILRFTPRQGRYIKSLPLHTSQEIIQDDGEGLVIKIKIHITYDFLMEILGHGESVKVIKPDSLILEMKRIYTKALELYNS